MKHIKTFENFDMYRENCDRCGASTHGKTIMSMFNNEIICMKCKEEEKTREDYEDAVNLDSIEHLTKLMNTASEKQNFEKAAYYRDLIQKIRTGERYRETEK